MLRAFSPSPKSLLRDAADLSIGGRDPRRTHWYYAGLACRISSNPGKEFSKALRKKKSLREYTNNLYHKHGLDSIDTEDQWQTIVGECEEDFRILQPLVTHVDHVPRGMYFPTTLTDIVRPELELRQPLPDGASSSATVSVQEFLVYVCRNRGAASSFPTAKKIRDHLAVSAGPYSPNSVSLYIERILREEENVPHIVYMAIERIFLDHSRVVIERLLERISAYIISTIRNDDDPDLDELRISVASHMAINAYRTNMEMVLETIRPYLGKKAFVRLIKDALHRSDDYYLASIRPNKPINLGAVLVAEERDHDYVVRYLTDRLFEGEYDPIHVEMNRARVLAMHEIVHLKPAVLDWLITQHAHIARGEGTPEMAVDHLFYPSEDNAHFIRHHYWVDWVAKESRIPEMAVEFFLKKYMPEAAEKSGSFKDKFYQDGARWTAYMRDTLFYRMNLIREAPSCSTEDHHSKYTADCIVGSFMDRYRLALKSLNEVQHHHRFDTMWDVRGETSLAYWLHNRFLPYTTIRAMISAVSTNQRLESMAGPSEGTRGVGAVVRTTSFSSDPAWHFDQPAHDTDLSTDSLVLVETDLIYSTETLSPSDPYGVGESINRQRMAFRKTLHHALLTAFPSEARGGSLVFLMARELPHGQYLDLRDTSLTWFLEDFNEECANMGHCTVVKTVKIKSRHIHVLWFVPSSVMEESEEDSREEAIESKESEEEPTPIYPVEGEIGGDDEQEMIVAALSAMLGNSA